MMKHTRLMSTRPGEHFLYSRPVETHFRKATCREVECTHHLMGWKTVVDTATNLGQMQAAYIRHQTGRHFTEQRAGETLVEFIFPPGQMCFREHKLPTGKPPSYFIGGREVEFDRWTGTWNDKAGSVNKALQAG